MKISYFSFIHVLFSPQFPVRKTGLWNQSCQFAIYSFIKMWKVSYFLGVDFPPKTSAAQQNCFTEVTQTISFQWDLGNKDEGTEKMCSPTKSPCNGFTCKWRLALQTLILKAQKFQCFSSRGQGGDFIHLFYFTHLFSYNIRKDVTASAHYAYIVKHKS